MTMTSRGSE
jgi:hypothetical protein